MERTLCIIKPDALPFRNEILRRLVQRGWGIPINHNRLLSAEQAARFYAVHQGKPFFHDHIVFMSSGPIIVMLLERDSAVAELRILLGPTDPKKGDPELHLRAKYGTGMPKNGFHGSDSVENAKREAAFFFSGMELGETLT